MTFSKTTCTVSQSHALKSNEEGNLMFQDGAFLFFFIVKAPMLLRGMAMATSPWQLCRSRHYRVTRGQRSLARTSSPPLPSVHLALVGGEGVRTSAQKSWMLLSRGVLPCKGMFHVKCFLLSVPLSSLRIVLTCLRWRLCAFTRVFFLFHSIHSPSCFITKNYGFWFTSSSMTFFSIRFSHSYFLPSLFHNSSPLSGFSGLLSIRPSLSANMRAVWQPWRSASNRLGSKFSSGPDSLSICMSDRSWLHRPWLRCRASARRGTAWGNQVIYLPLTLCPCITITALGSLNDFLWGS